MRGRLGLVLAVWPADGLQRPTPADFIWIWRERR